MDNLGCRDDADRDRMYDSENRSMRVQVSEGSAAGVRSCPGRVARGRLCLSVLLAFVLVGAFRVQSAASAQEKGSSIAGVVLDAHALPVGGAMVRLAGPDASVQVRKTNEKGEFVFAGVTRGDYRLSAEKGGLHSQTATVSVLRNKKPETVRLQFAARAGSPAAMAFSDQPSFTIAGVTDWTAVGGHGSDANLRISESLARDTLRLKPPDSRSRLTDAAQARQTERRLRAVLAADPGSFAPNHQLGEFYLRSGRYRQAVPLLRSAWRIDPGNEENTWDLALACRDAGDYHQALALVEELLHRGAEGKWYRLAGDLDEHLQNPLGAVHDYQRAVELAPTERNYFSLGSDLLLHRAIWQAQAVFRKGATAYPRSVRMLTGLGAALFAGALYDQAARQLCLASDLAPSDPEPYVFMGNVEIASPNPLPCVQSRLARFVQLRPSDTTANYLYAMAILKTQERSPNPLAVERAKVLLRKAAALDPQNGKAWLQLGDLSAARGDYPAAIGLYRRAIAADPQLAEAYYRLGVAYDHTGNRTLAQQQFRLHDQIAKSRTEAVDRQRRSIQQFLFAQSETPPPKENR